MKWMVDNGYDIGNHTWDHIKLGDCTADEIEKQVTKDAPSRLHARRQILRYLYPVVEVPQEAKGRKKNTKKVDLVNKMFTEYGPKYAGRNGGYTRIIKIGQRRGDGAMEVVLEFV